VAAPTPVAAKVLGAVSQQEWSDWMRSLPVRGLVQQLAFQTELQSWQEGASGASASVVVSMAQYATADNVARLQDALSKHLGRQVKILVETGKVSQSVAAVEARVKQEKQSGAEESIANDDFIKSLQDELGATIVPGSIRPIQ
jgi:DNA polymerase-3 subunit gamma/tau